MLIDTHAHLNFNAYRKDANEVIKKSLENDVWLINVGSQYETSKRAVEIAEKYSEGVYAAVGLHPIHLAKGIFKTKIDKEEITFKTIEKNFNTSEYRSLVVSSKVVAIGETGLDYYYRPKTKIKLQQFKERQKEVFLEHLSLAKELNLPVIFHCRMAHEDLLEILNYKLKTINYKLKGVMHGFVGTAEQLQEYLKMGLYIGFNGIIFKKIEGIDFAENIRKTPLDKILIETDCPYLTPPLPADLSAGDLSEAEALAKAGPMANRNEPLYIKYVAEKIAQIKNLNPEEIAKITTENTKKLFNI